MKIDGDFDNVRTDVSLTTVDTHTAGEPTRVLLDGLDWFIFTATAFARSVNRLPNNTTGSVNY